MNQIVSRKSLHQSGLPVTTGAENHATGKSCGAACANQIHGALLATIFPRRSSTLNGTGHFRELAFPLLFGQWTNFLFIIFLCSQNVFHQLTVEDPTHGADVGDLRAIFVPNGMRKTSPRQSQLRLDEPRYPHFVRYRVPSRRNWLCLGEVFRIPFGTK